MSLFSYKTIYVCCVLLFRFDNAPWLVALKGDKRNDFKKIKMLDRKRNNIAALVFIFKMVFSAGEMLFNTRRALHVKEKPINITHKNALVICACVCVYIWGGESFHCCASSLSHLEKFITDCVCCSASVGRSETIENSNQFFFSLFRSLLLLLFLQRFDVCAGTLNCGRLLRPSIFHLFRPFSCWEKWKCLFSILLCVSSLFFFTSCSWWNKRRV